jgi:AcrR family transcriptional regulator
VTGAVQPRPRKESAKARATRESLIELAAEMFADSGYVSTSIRDISRSGAMTTGAIYGHFRNKADLLAAAIRTRTASELESRSMPVGADSTYIETLTRLALEYQGRHQLRALILQGAAASQTDEETRTLLKEEQESYLSRWLEQYQETRDSMGIDPSVDMRAALLYTWAAELGLGVLEAIGVELPSPQSWSDIHERVGRSLQLPPTRRQGKTRPSRRRSLRDVDH